LKAAGIPVAYVSRFGPTEFVAEKTKMIYLEVIGRRLGIGSYLKRNPWEKQEPPMRFHQVKAELFLKTTKGGLKVGKNVLVSGLTKEQDDPFIDNPQEKEWRLMDPAKPEFHSEADLGWTVSRDQIVSATNLAEIEGMLRKCFLFLEGLFQTFGYRFADFKIEFGITTDGRVVISDVIDQDSWRLLSWDWQHFSKQAFRDGEDISEVERKYGFIARMSEFFRIPRQALVVWCGSSSDKFDLPAKMPGVDIIRIDMSGHKKTLGSLQHLEKMLTAYPDGGVIITNVGRSNGLGPILAAHTSWQIVTVPADWKEKPQNVWSHLDMPSMTPLLTCLYNENAILAAMNILAAKNPAVYMQRQFDLEKLEA
jgi:phosphoribosylaminoimidazole carboxylase/phosphoribosylaminoimidazole-succinocarboxamide synthase